MIKKEGNKWTLYSKDGSKILKQGTKKEVEDREKEIKMFVEIEKKKKK